MINKRILTAFSTLAILLYGSLIDASACAVCFGEKGTPLANAYDKMVYIMLGCMVVLFTAIISFFVTLYKRGKKAIQEEEIF